MVLPTSGPIAASTIISDTGTLNNLTQYIVDTSGNTTNIGTSTYIIGPNVNIVPLNTIPNNGGFLPPSSDQAIYIGNSLNTNTNTTNSGTSYITINNSGLFGFTWTSGLTVESWVNFNSFHNLQTPCLCGYMDPISGTYNWSFGVNQNGYVSFQYNNGALVSINSTTQLYTNTWYHIAASYVSGIGLSIYINGAQSGITTAVSGTPTLTATKLTIGQFTNTTNNIACFCDAYISNLRIASSALYTTSLISSLPLSSLVPVTNTKLLLRAPVSNIIDTTGIITNTVNTITGNVIGINSSLFTGLPYQQDSCFSFNGSNSYISVPITGNNNLQLTNNWWQTGFCVEAFVNNLSTSTFTPYGSYPPAALTGNLYSSTSTPTSNISSVSGQSYGNGNYTTTSSSSYNTGAYPYYLFDKTTTGWACSGPPPYNSITGLYTSTYSTTVSGSAVLGEWIDILLPNSIILTSYTIIARTDATGYVQSPYTWIIAGTNNAGSTWTQVDSQTNIIFTSGQINQFITTNTISYNEYRIIIKSIQPNSGGVGGYINFAEWVLNSSINNIGLCTIPTQTTSAVYNWLFGINNLGYINFAYNGIIISGSTYIPTNKWNHIAVTCDGAYIRLFLNGSIETIATITTTALSINTSAAGMGITLGGFNGSYINALISNVHITNGIPPNYSTTATYYGAKVFNILSTSPLIPIQNISVLLLRGIVATNSLTGILTDKTGKSQNIFNNNIILTTAGYLPPTNCGAIYLPNISAGGNYISNTNATNYAISNNSTFTIEVWVYYLSFSNTATGNNPTLIGHMSPSSTTNNDISFGVNTSGNVVLYYANNGTPGNLASTNTLSVHTWNHIAVTYDATNIRIFINGILNGSFALATFNRNVSSTTITIGQYNTSYYSYCYISNLRYCASALYTATFTPSTSPLLPITTAKNYLLLRGCTSIIDFSKNVTNVYSSQNSGIAPYLISLVGTSGATPPTQGDGVIGILNNSYTSLTNYITFASLTGATFTWWNTSFTIETWVYYLSGGNEFSATQSSLLGMMSPTASTSYWSFGRTSNNNLVFYGATSGTAFTLVSSSIINNNQWYHIAVSYDSISTTMIIFINGTVSKSTSTIITGTTPSGNFTIGVYNTSYYTNAYISNLRIVSGSALYTTGFIPSNIPFGPSINGNTILLLRIPPISYPLSSLSFGNLQNQAYRAKNPKINKNYANNAVVLVTPNTNLPNNSVSYTTNYDPYFGNVVLLLHGENLLDSSLNTKIMTFSSISISSTIFKFGSGSFNFAGTSFFNVAYQTADLAFGNQNFTMEFWMYPLSIDAFSICNNFIFVQNNLTSNGVNQYTIYLAGGLFRLYIGNYATTQIPLLITNTKLVISGWYHIALVRSGNIFAFFINGICDVTATFNGNIDSGISEVIYVGYPTFNGGNFYWPGNIDEFRITKGIARYQINNNSFLPSTVSQYSTSAPADPYIQNVSLLMNCDFIADSSYIPNTLTTSGTVGISSNLIVPQYNVLNNLTNVDIYYSSVNYLLTAQDFIDRSPTPLAFTNTTVLLSNAYPYPPAALTNTSTTLSGQTYGNGTYTTTASSIYTGGEAFRAFDKGGGLSIWNNANGVYNPTTGLYTSGTYSTTVSGNLIYGEWLDIYLPNTIALVSYSILSRNDIQYGQTPYTWIIAGTNNAGAIWTQIDSKSNQVFSAQNQTNIYTINNNITGYNGYRIIILAIQPSGNYYVSIAEWILYGSIYYPFTPLSSVYVPSITSFYFNGASFLTSPSTTSVAIGGNSFTLEFFINVATNGYYSYLMGNGTSAAFTTNQWYLALNNSNQLQLFLGNYSNPGNTAPGTNSIQFYIYQTTSALSTVLVSSVSGLYIGQVIYYSGATYGGLTNANYYMITSIPSSLYYPYSINLSASLASATVAVTGTNTSGIITIGAVTNANLFVGAYVIISGVSFGGLIAGIYTIATIPSTTTITLTGFTPSLTTTGTMAMTLPLFGSSTIAVFTITAVSGTTITYTPATALYIGQRIQITFGALSSSGLNYIVYTVSSTPNTTSCTFFNFSGGTVSGLSISAYVYSQTNPTSIAINAYGTRPILTSNNVLSINTNTWYYIALTCNYQGLISLYINGTFDTNANVTPNTSQQFNYGFDSGAAQSIYIGKDNVTGHAMYFNGNLQCVRFTKGICRYSANYSTPTTQFSFINTQISVLNKSINNGTGTLSFPGSSYIYTPASVAPNNQMALGSMNFTIEFWLYPTNIQNIGNVGARYIMGNSVTAGTQSTYGANIWFLKINALGFLEFWVYNFTGAQTPAYTYSISGTTITTLAASSTITVTSSTGFYSGQPVYISGTTFGNLSTGTYYIASVIGTTQITLATDPYLVNIFIGSGAFTGTMTITPMTNYYVLITSTTALSSNIWNHIVLMRNNNYFSIFINGITSAPVSILSDYYYNYTTLILNGEDVVDKSGYAMLTGTATSATTPIVSAIYKSSGSSSLSFNGSTQFINTSSSTNFALSANSFTIEFQILTTAPGNYQFIMGNGSGIAFAANQWFLTINPSQFLELYLGNQWGSTINLVSITNNTPYVGVSNADILTVGEMITTNSALGNIASGTYLITGITTATTIYPSISISNALFTSTGTALTTGAAPLMIAPYTIYATGTTVVATAVSLINQGGTVFTIIGTNITSNLIYVNSTAGLLVNTIIQLSLTGGSVNASFAGLENNEYYVIASVTATAPANITLYYINTTTTFIPTQTTTGSLTATTIQGIYITSTANLYPNMYFWLTGTSFAGININTISTPYQIQSILSSTTITIIGQPPTSTTTGSMTFNTTYVTCSNNYNLGITIPFYNTTFINFPLIFPTGAGTAFGGLALNTVYYILSVPTAFQMTCISGIPINYYQFFQIGIGTSSTQSTLPLVTLSTTTGTLFGFLNSILITATNTNGNITIGGNYYGYIKNATQLLIPTTNSNGLNTFSTYIIGYGEGSGANIITLGTFNYYGINYQSFYPLSTASGLTIIGIIGASFVTSTVSGSPFISIFRLQERISTYVSYGTNYLALNNSIGFIGTSIGGISVTTPYYITSFNNIYGHSYGITMTTQTPVINSTLLSNSIIATSTASSGTVVAKTALTVYSTIYFTNYVTVSSTIGVSVGQLITLTGTPFGGLTQSTYSIRSIIDNNNLELNYINNQFIANTTITGNLIILQNAFTITNTNLCSLTITNTYQNSFCITVTAASLQSFVGFISGYVAQPYMNMQIDGEAFSDQFLINTTIYKNMYIYIQTTLGGLTAGSYYNVSAIINSTTIYLNPYNYNPLITASGSISASIYSYSYPPSASWGIGAFPSGVTSPPGYTLNTLMTSILTTSYITSQSGQGTQLILSGTAFGGMIPTITITGITIGTNNITVSSILTANIYTIGTYPYNSANIPITISGTSFGNLKAGTYIIQNIVNATTITLQNFTVTATATGSMTGTCYMYYIVSNPHYNAKILSLSQNYWPYYTPSSAASGTLTASVNTQIITNTINTTITITAISNGGIITVASTNALYPGLAFIPQQSIYDSTNSNPILIIGSIYYIYTILTPTTFTFIYMTNPTNNLTLSLTGYVYGIITTGTSITTSSQFYLSGTVFGGLSTTQLYYVMNIFSISSYYCTVIQISTVSALGPLFIPTAGNFTGTSPLLICLDALNITSVSIGNSILNLNNPLSTGMATNNSAILTGTAFGGLQTNYQYTINNVANNTQITLNQYPTSYFIATSTANGSLQATFTSPIYRSLNQISTNSFTNIAIVRNINNLKIYFNGSIDTNINSLTQSTTPYYNYYFDISSSTAQTLYIGKDNILGHTNFFQGFIDNFRFTSNIPRYQGTNVNMAQNFPLINLTSSLYAIDGGDSGTAYSLIIGTDGINTHGGAGYYYQGFIDEIRITKGYARYSNNLNFTPSTLFPIMSSDIYYNNTYLTIGYTNIINENGGLQSTQKLIKNNNFTTTAQNTVKFGQSSLYFNGTTQYLYTNPSSTFNIGRSDFTIEFWMNAQAVAGYIMGNGIGLVSGPTNWWIYYSGSTLYLSKNNTQITLTSVAITANSWTHIAFVRNGCMFTIYVNGSKSAAPSGTGSSTGYFYDSIDSNGNYTETINIGWDGISGHAFYTGYLDDVRITKGTALYNYSIATFGTNQATNYSLPFLPKYTFPVPNKYYINNQINTIVPCDGISDAKNRVLINPTTVNGYSVINIPSLNTTNYVYANTKNNNVYGSIYFNNMSFITFYGCSAGSMTITGISSTLFFGGNSYITVTSPVPSFTYIGQTIILTGTNIGNLIPGSYTINSIINSTTITLNSFIAQITTTGTMTATFSYQYGNTFLVSSNTNLYVGQAITIISAVGSTAIGNLTLGTTYYIYNIINSNTITLSASALLQTILTVTTTTTGYMVGQIFISNISTTQSVISTITTSTTSSALADYSIGSGLFTIEFWIKIINNNSFNYILSNGYSAAGFTTSCWYICLTQNGILQINFAGTLYSSIIGLYNYLITALNVNGFTHIAIVRTTTSYINIFMNGINVGIVTTIFTGISTFPQSYAISLDATGLWLYTIGSANFAGLYQPSLNGYIDDIRITIGTARYNSQFNIPTSCYCIDPIIIDPYYTNVSLLLKGYSFGLFDLSYNTKLITQNIINSSTNNNYHFISNNVVKYGTGSLGFNYISGQSYQINSGDFSAGMNSITVEFWINITNGNITSNGPQYVIGSQYNNNNNWWITIVITTLNTPLLTLTIQDGTGQTYVLQTTALTLNTWYFCTFMRVSTLTVRPSIVYLYINTAVSASAILPASTYIDSGSGGNIYIGSTPSPNLNNTFGGFLDDIRITQNVARYITSTTLNPPLSTITIPTAALNTYTDPYYNTNANTILILDCNNTGNFGINVSDFSSVVGSQKLVETSGTLIQNTNVSYNRFGYNSIGFNVFPQTNINIQNYQNCYVKIGGGGNADLAFGTCNLTIEFWLYLTNLNAQFIIGNNWSLPGTLNGSNLWYLNCVAGVLNLYMNILTVNGTYVLTNIVSTSVLTINTWYFITIVRNDCNINIYSSGTSIGINTNMKLPVGTSMDSGSAETIYLGAAYGNSSLPLASDISSCYLPYFSGYIDSLRITKNVVRPLQQFLYNNTTYAISYTAPASSLSLTITGITNNTNIVTLSAAASLTKGTIISIGYGSFSITGINSGGASLITTNNTGLTNGQNIYISPGYITITAVSTANPSVITVSSSGGLAIGMTIQIFGGIPFGGFVQNGVYTINTIPSGTQITLQNFTPIAPYAGTMYAGFTIGNISSNTIQQTATVTNISSSTAITINGSTPTYTIAGTSGTNISTANYVFGNLQPGYYMVAATTASSTTVSLYGFTANTTLSGGTVPAVISNSFTSIPDPYNYNPYVSLLLNCDMITDNSINTKTITTNQPTAISITGTNNNGIITIATGPILYIGTSINIYSGALSTTGFTYTTYVITNIYSATTISLSLNGTAFYPSNASGLTISAQVISLQYAYPNTTYGYMMYSFYTQQSYTSYSNKLISVASNSSCLYLKGAFLNAGANIDYAMGQGNFTIEFWMAPAPTQFLPGSNSPMFIIGNGVPATGIFAANRWFLLLNSNNNLELWVYNYSQFTYLISTASQNVIIIRNIWSHIAIVRNVAGSTSIIPNTSQNYNNGYFNDICIYVNGEVAADFINTSATTIANILYPASLSIDGGISENLIIGGNGNNPTTTVATISATTSITNVLTVNTTVGLYTGITITLAGTAIGGLATTTTNSLNPAAGVYIVSSVINSTAFTVSNIGSMFLSNASGGSITIITPGNLFTGYMDDIRVTKGVARYSYNTSFSLSANPIFDTNYAQNTASSTNTTPISISADSYDNLVTPNVIINNNVILNTIAPYKFGNGCYQFMSILQSSLTIVASLYVNCTLEFWMYTQNNNGFIIGGNSGWALNLRDNYLYFYCSNGANANNTNVAISLNIWYHIAITYYGDGNCVIVYIDGDAIIVAANGYLNDVNILLGSTVYMPMPCNFNGYIDNLRITPALLYNYATITRIPVHSFTQDNTYNKNIILLLNFERNNITDLSLYANTINQAVVSVNTSNSYNGSGSSLYFNGINQYISTSSSVDFTLGTNNFTIEFWMNYNNGINNNGITGISGIIMGSVSSYWQLSLNNNKLKLQFASTFIMNGNIKLNYGVWYNIVIIRNINQIMMFVNGTLDASFSLPITTPFDTSSITATTIYIGYGTIAPLTYFAGYICELRCTKGIVRYPGNTIIPRLSYLGINNSPLNACTINDPYFSNLSLYLNFVNSALLDSSAYMRSVSNTYYQSYGNISNISGTQNINISSSNIGTIGYGSYFFNGSNISISTTNTSSYVLGTNNFTIEFWMYAIGNNGIPIATAMNILGNNYNLATSGLTATTWIIYINTSGKILFGYGASSTAIITSNIVLYYNVWYHIAITRSNNYYFTLYVNGYYDSSNPLGSISTTLLLDSGISEKLTIGYSSNAAVTTAAFFNGYMTDIRITKNIARYTGNFLLQTASFPQLTQNLQYDQYFSTNVVLLLHFNNNFLDYSVNGMLLTNINNVIFNNIYKFGNASAAFNGNNYLVTTNSQIYSLGTANSSGIFSLFSIEFWLNVKFSTLPPTGSVTGIIGNGKNNTTYGGWYYALNPTGTSSFYHTGPGGLITSAGTAIIANGNWNFIQIIRSTTTAFNVYVNQTADISITLTTTNYFDFGTGDNLYLGWDGITGHYKMNGYIDEFRFTKGQIAATSATIRSIALTQTIQNPSLPYFGDQYYNSVSLLCHFQNTLLDSGPNAYINNSTMSILSGKVNFVNGISVFGNYSLYFDGNTIYTTGVNPIFTFNTKLFTIEFWMFVPNFTVARNILGNGNGGNFSGNQWYLSISVTGSLILYVYNYTGLTAFITTTPISTNCWNHIVITKNTTAGVIYIYINGTGSTATNAGSFDGAYKNNIIIGGTNMQNVATNFIGYISELRITNGISRYNSTGIIFNPQTIPCTTFPNFGPQAQMLTDQYNPTSFSIAPTTFDQYFDNNLIYLPLSSTGSNITTYMDISNSNLTISAYTPTLNLITIDPTGSYGIFNQGITGSTSNYLLSTPVYTSGFTTNYITFETWVKFNNVSSQQVFAGNCTGTFTTGTWYLKLSATATIQFFLYDYSSSVPLLSSFPILANIWLHVCITKNGNSTNNYSLYINGLFTNSGTYTATITPILSSFQIGGANNSANTIYLTGNMTGYRLTSSVRYLNNFPILPTGTAINSNLNTSLLLYPQTGYNPITNYQTPVINTVQYDPYYSYTSILSHFEGINVATNSSGYNIIPQYNSLLSQLPKIIGNSSMSFSNNTQLQYITDTQPILDGLSIISSNSIVGAYALKRLFTNYKGPVVNLRRSSDSATTDFYANAATGNLGTYYNGGGFTLAAWSSNATPVYITKIYNQNGNTATYFYNDTAATQPILVSTCNNYYMQFLSTSNLKFSTTIAINNNYTICSGFIPFGYYTTTNSNIMYQDGILTSLDTPQFKLNIQNGSNLSFGNCNGYCYQSSAYIPTNGYSNFTLNTLNINNITNQINLYRGQQTSNISLSNIITTNTSGYSYQLTANTYIGYESTYKSQLNAQISSLLIFNNQIPYYDLAVINSNLTNSNVLQ